MRPLFVDSKVKTKAKTKAKAKAKAKGAVFKAIPMDAMKLMVIKAKTKSGKVYVKGKLLHAGRLNFTLNCELYGVNELDRNRLGGWSVAGATGKGGGAASRPAQSYKQQLPLGGLLGAATVNADASQPEYERLVSSCQAVTWLAQKLTSFFFLLLPGAADHSGATRSLDESRQGDLHPELRRVDRRARRR